MNGCIRFRTIGTCERAVSGFTLIELLVVVSIIALLISILIPSLKGARDQGKTVKCLSHLRGCGQAAVVFAGSHDDRFPLATDEVGVGLADPDRRRFTYDVHGELFSWPVALAAASRIQYEGSWDWGVRAASYSEAKEQAKEMSDDFELVMCPADRVRISTPYYPRFKSADNNGLKGDGETGDNMAYWGYLSYGLNEDIAGAEVEESGGNPACWTAVETDSGWMGCKGEMAYPPSSPCGARRQGQRLQGRLDRVYSPGSVGLVFEAGPDTDSAARSSAENEYANLMTSARADGPYLADFQQRFGKRMPTKRHPKGRINVLFADIHGETVSATDYSAENRLRVSLPSEYTPNVRVSPYRPRPVR